MHDVHGKDKIVESDQILLPTCWCKDLRWQCLRKTCLPRGQRDRTWTCLEDNVWIYNIGLIANFDFVAYFDTVMTSRLPPNPHPIPQPNPTPSIMSNPMPQLIFPSTSTLVPAPTSSLPPTQIPTPNTHFIVIHKNACQNPSMISYPIPTSTLIIKREGYCSNQRELGVFIITDPNS